MQTTRIIGIDPGLVHTGWGIINCTAGQLSFVACGVISPPVKLALSERLLILSAALDEVISGHKPQESAIEETFVTQNGASTLKLGQARGALLLTLAQHQLHAGEYAAKRIKKALTGTGSADKQQIIHMVGMLLPAAQNTLSTMKNDAADALAIAICHAHSRGF
jgi:crossover junction endodeoxyribonuclease RuvC